MKKQYKIMIVLAICVVPIIAVWLIMNNRSNQKSAVQYSTERVSAIEDIMKDVTELKQGDLAFSEVKLNTVAAMNVIQGKVRNEGQTEINCRLHLKMYQSKNDRTLGVAETKIENLNPGEETEFEIRIVGDYKAANRFAVEVLNMATP